MSFGIGFGVRPSTTLNLVHIFSAAADPRITAAGDARITAAGDIRIVASP